MLNDEEIKERADFKAAVILGELVTINPIMTQWFKNGYMLGYTQAQETIPSECIAFAEWFYNKVWRDHKNETWTMYGAGANPFTAEQLFNVYLQEQTQK
jgi:hypothetical protein